MKTTITSPLARTAILCGALLFALPATTAVAGDGHHGGHSGGHSGGHHGGIHLGFGGHYGNHQNYYGGGLSYSYSRRNFGHVGGYYGYGGLHGRYYGGLHHSDYLYNGGGYGNNGGYGDERGCDDDSRYRGGPVYAPPTYPIRQPIPEPQYIAPPPQSDPYPVTPHQVNNHRDNGRGWEYLANGFYDRALTVFAREASRNPQAGAPKVGYALAAAATGNLTRGASSMRRAFRIDPDAIHYIVIDKNLAPTLHRLIDRYEDRQARSTNSRDTSFMLAALNFLRRDLTSARADIRQAMDYGDRTTSAATLQRMIADEMETVQSAKAEDDEDIPVDETTPSTQPVPPVPQTSDSEADY